MNYKITKLFSMLMLGAVLSAAPSLAHAQTATTDSVTTAPIPTQQEIRDARNAELDALRDKQTSARAAERAAVHAREFDKSKAIRTGNTLLNQAARDVQNSTRAAEIQRIREDERDKAIDKRFTRDVFMILNNRINQYIELDARADMAAEQALRYGGFCTTDAQGKRVCVQGTEDQKFRQIEKEARDVRRKHETELYGAACPRDKDGFRLKDAKGNVVPCAGGTLRQKELDAIEVRKDLRDKATGDRKAIYDKRNAENKAIADKRAGGIAGDPLTTRTIGNAITNFGKNLVNFPALFYLLSYICGVYFMAMGLVKANRTAMEPSRNPLSDAVKYIVAGVFLAALPVTVDVLNKSFGFRNGSILNLDYSRGLRTASGAAEGGAAGLDQFIVNLVKDITTPLLSITALIAFAAGVFMIFQALQRLTKGTQEGPKGPAGLGTMMNFVVGSALISFVPTLKIVIASVFGDS